jgi:hypothetical protein
LCGSGNFKGEENLFFCFLTNQTISIEILERCRYYAEKTLRIRASTFLSFVLTYVQYTVGTVVLYFQNLNFLGERVWEKKKKKR